jgi:DNA-binding NarL/FixJ family response regulator
MNPPKLTSKPGLQSHRRIRTLLVDDSQLMREFLTRLIGRESDFELVGTAADGREALRSTAALRPELILMDVQMPYLDGLEATRIIKQFGVQVGYAPMIVIVTSDDTLECRSRAEDAGANGFVLKSEHLGAQLSSTLENLFSGNCESLPVNPIEDCHESSCA